MELHGGTAQAESEGPGKGSTFRVTMPARAGGAGAGAGRSADDRPSGPRVSGSVPPPAAAGLSGVRVLVVDDEEDARALAVEVLSAEGAEVVAVEKAADAVAAVARGAADVLVADIGLPEEDGYALIRRVRALPPAEGGAMPAVALTAFARVEDRARALESGYDVHVPKPFEARELVSVVATLAAHAARGAGARG
jgi:CheY-like chemotaxis protein